MTIKLFYLHDPMCSWCWGYTPTWYALEQHLPVHLTVEYVAGGLASDCDEPMPEVQQKMIQKHWRTIEHKLGTQFNFDFWTNNIPRRSTYNACRAAIAADKQGYQRKMIELIQHGYYLKALNPSDMTVLLDLGKKLAKNIAYNSENKEKYTHKHFDPEQFNIDIHSNTIEQELQRQIALSSSLNQQGFPALVLKCHDEYHQIPINYDSFEPTLATISKLLKAS